MNRTREIADTSDKRQKRYRLYKSVIGRYREAIDKGFYLEAITLMESIITDRLESVLIYYGLMNREKAFRTMEFCLQLFNETQGIISDELYNRIVDWKNERNHALHEMAKIEEGDESSFSQRYNAQKKVAEQGYELFKAIKAETK